MAIPLLIVVVVALCVAVALVRRRRPSSLSDVDRFHRAHELTSTWSAQYTGEPVREINLDEEARPRAKVGSSA